MSKFSDELRSKSDTLLQGAASMLEGLNAAPAALAMKLTDAQAKTTIEGIRASLDVLITELQGEQKADRLVKAIACLVTGNLYAAMADQTDYLQQSGAMRSLSDRLRQRSEMNAKIRTAAAAGAWDEYDRLVSSVLDIELGRNGDAGREGDAAVPGDASAVASGDAPVGGAGNPG